VTDWTAVDRRNGEGRVQAPVASPDDAVSRSVDDPRRPTATGSLEVVRPR